MKRIVLIIFLITVAIILLTSLVFSYLIISNELDGNSFTVSDMFYYIKLSLVCVVPQVIILTGIFYFLISRKIIKI